MAGSGIFRSLLPFSAVQIKDAPKEPGVYIVYDRGLPFYVGRSRVSMYKRLRRHLRGSGNRGVAAAVRSGVNLHFEFQTMISPEQGEAQLIDFLHVLEAANCHRETDPADRL